MLKADPSLAGAFTAQLSDYELCRLNVCCCRDWRMDGKGEAGFIYSLDNYGMPDFAAADGNNGVNIKKHNIGMPSSTMVNAGVSWLTPGSDSDERVLPLLEGLKAGKITREQLEENIYFLIKTILKYV